MSVDKHRELIRRFNEEVWGMGRVDLVDDLFSPDFLDHYTAPGGPPGRDGIKYDVERVRKAFPDLEINTEEIICEGDKAALRWSGRGTYRGGIPGITASGRPVVMSGTHFYRIRDGRIVERWVEFDRMGVLQQLGATQ
jgi:steroid delta-isomerase-like uncharacterized protein